MKLGFKKKSKMSENEKLDTQNLEDNTAEEATVENSHESSEPIEEISETDKLLQEKAELQDKYLRLYSEFDNYRKRTIKEKSDLISTAGQNVIEKLLPVFDDFDRAVLAIEKAEDKTVAIDGINLLYKKLQSILQQIGLKELETIGADFDADKHEAITSIKAPTEEMKGKVIDQIEKGYTLGDKIIRFAKVVVGE